ncbi:hypothetical protein EXE46_08735 [Halorubrum sp. GN11_10-6_MGM]|nr:hypothetical protein EXE46_08735 [Halorubrum sp. GN11_10-6_MGM]
MDRDRGYTHDELLHQELRSAREELVRKRARRSESPAPSESRLPLMPEHDEGFIRLALMSVEELETHIERIERDLADLQEGVERPDE